MALIYKKTNENFIKEFRKVHGNKYNYSKINYINNTTNLNNYSIFFDLILKKCATIAYLSIIHIRVKFKYNGKTCIK